MIKKIEILTKAKELNLKPDIVEKDYVLNWILAGIAADPVLSKSQIFKGGTCLKKCFFENYRFSEDLDFTLTDQETLNSEFLAAQFNQIAKGKTIIIATHDTNLAKRTKKTIENCAMVKCG